MTPKEKANIRAVKNKLCEIDDALGEVFIDKKNPEKTAKAIMIQRYGIDKCVKTLEGLLGWHK